MSKPTHSENAGIHSLTWDQEQIHIRVDRMVQHTEHLSGEVTVSSGPLGHIHWARLNLTSTPARRTFSKQLEERLSSVDWYAITEELCLAVIGKYRAGEPAVKLGEQSTPERVSYRIRPIVPERQPTIIYGVGGTGKTLIAQFLSVLVETPLSLCGMEAEPGNVLYLDYETTGEDAALNVKRIQRGMDIHTGSEIMYRRCTQPLASDIEQIQRLVIDHDIDMVVVDSFGYASVGEIDKADAAMSHFRALRTLNTTTITLDHVAKDTERRDTPYGSIYKYNSARSVWEVRKSQSPGEDRLDIALFHRKMNMGKLEQAIGIRIDFADNAITFERQDVRDTELSAGLGIKERAVHALKEGKLPIEELAERLDVSERSLATILYRNKNDFQKVGEDWGLKQKVGFN